MGHRSPEAGFTLLEVLIALCVLATGMLGIGMMLLESVRASRSALHRTAAVALAADLGERIRANRVAGDAYALGAGTMAGAPASECTVGDACDSSEVAALDLYQWQQVVLARCLPPWPTCRSHRWAGCLQARMRSVFAGRSRATRRRQRSSSRCRHEHG